MPLHPEVQKILAEAAAADVPPPHELPVPMARAQMVKTAPDVEIERSAARLEDLAIPGPGGEIPARVYHPKGEGPFPVIVYFHGGGWVIGDLDTHNALCNAICSICETVVVSVDYRLAPEHVYPAAAEDCFAATCWVAENAASLRGDPGRLVVAGDSAGGNLAAVVSLMCRDRQGPDLALQALVYPITDCDFETASYRENAEGYHLTREMMIWFWELYTPGMERAREPYVSPLRAGSLSGLPPALVITAEYDPLRDEGEAYARALAEAGCAVELARFDGMIHGFFRMTSRLQQSIEAIRRIAGAIRGDNRPS